MKMLKKIMVASFLIAITVTCSSIYATPASVLNSTGQGNIIHTTVVHTNKKPIKVTILLKVGVGDQSNCNPQANVIEFTDTIKDGTTMALDGDLLARSMGISYSCAMEIYAPNKGGIKKISYALINDGKTYSDTDPNHQEAYLSK